MAGWNIIPVMCAPIHNCYTELHGNLKCYPRFLITAKMIGSSSAYPAWGFDNISTPVSLACAMHDNGCCPALYPRPAVSHYPTVHSGYYGRNFQYCPPQWFLDGRDSTGTVYGFVELAWRLYLSWGHSDTEPSTWGAIKAIYK
jgi:hypothetical protein